MPIRPAASAHWYFRCSVGVTTVTAAMVRSASSSAAIRSPNVVLPAPGVAAARKSLGEAARYRASARRCQPRRPGPAGAELPSAELPSAELPGVEVIGAVLGGAVLGNAVDGEREPGSDTRLLSAAAAPGGGGRVRTQRRCHVGDTGEYALPCRPVTTSVARTRGWSRRSSH